MKNIKSILLILTVALLSSCSDSFLEVDPYGAPSTTTFWKTESDALKATNALYGEFIQWQFYSREYYCFINAGDDMVTGRVKSTYDNIKNFICTGNEWQTSNYWEKHFQIMKRCNDVIEHVPSMNIDEKVKQNCLGQAYFIHAVMHLELAQKYGDHRAGINIMDREDRTNKDLPRPENVSVNYEYIIKDLEKAAEYLPYFDELSAEDYGRAHKVAAWAYIAKACIFNAQYDESYWAKAEAAADLVITKGKRKLEDNFADAFRVENNVGSEYVWSIPSDIIHGSNLPAVVWENKGWGQYNGWGYFHPTHELYAEFEDGDERREWTVIKDGDKFTYFGDTEFVYDVSVSNTVSGYMLGKWRDVFEDADAIGKTLNPDPGRITSTLWTQIIRYAEVILWKAEAKLMQGENADTEINMIRERAGLAKKSNCTMADLKHERRCELAFEWNDRHFDLVRWGDADKTYEKPLHAADGSEIWPARPQFDPAIHHVWPIPPYQVSISDGFITQNEGW
ncbi:MAG: RagB/SusD family nutrient uptake outer membrane protein [Carboxylicivirga sp.]|nr:RagB/SusD family nutrient uptake outer membrane protein [Carboxylicivirga sp.]